MAPTPSLNDRAFFETQLTLFACHSCGTRLKSRLYRGMSYMQEESDNDFDDDDDDADYSDDADGPDASVDTEPCPHCGRPIYEQAEVCPHCGNYVSEEDSSTPKPKWIVIAAIVVLAAILWGWVLRR